MNLFWSSIPFKTSPSISMEEHKENCYSALETFIYHWLTFTDVSNNARAILIIK